LADAILGTCGGGDIGQHFPDTDPAYAGVESGVLVKECQLRAEGAGVEIVAVDLTVIAQVPKISPHREALRKSVARLLGLSVDRVNVKATTEEKLGFTGAKKGIKAVACVSALRILK
ncbi:MAG: 2-C-methyl-D-erythritol 2,4-cyclodiphosphate synthase, partial [Proteobacteria bacterium]|nr:2-C-methyl-D-erythritol 2,4-cyclodiphosphate synthase [Pseudomonadota bacterium]